MSDELLHGLSTAWVELQDQINRLTDQRNKLEKAMAPMVTELGKTVVLNGVRMRYNAPRKKYNYEAAGKSAPQGIIDKHTTPTVDWRSVVKDAGIVYVPFEQGETPTIGFIYEPK